MTWQSVRNWLASAHRRALRYAGWGTRAGPVATIERFVRKRRARYERILRTSQEIDRQIAHRRTLGEQPQPYFFDGPGSEGDAVAAAALLAAADGKDAADPTVYARMVAAAAFDTRFDLKAVLLEISMAASREADVRRDTPIAGRMPAPGREKQSEDLKRACTNHSECIDGSI